MSRPLRFPDPPPWLNERPVTLRYEDVLQDGHLRISSLPFTIGEVIWRGILTDEGKAVALNRAGVVPIITRLMLEVHDGPVSISNPLTGRGSYQLARSERDGVLDKLFLNLWVDLHGIKATTRGPAPADAGARVHTGRIHVENVFSRPLAPPDQRKVTSLDALDLPLPQAVHTWMARERYLELVEGAEALDGDWRDDSVPMVFGLDHTDANQHVNSLAYPTLCIPAALRRLTEHGIDPYLACHRADIAFRKPFFAGQSAQVRMRAFRSDGQPGVIGTLHDGSDAGGRPHCYFQFLFARRS